MTKNTGGPIAPRSISPHKGGRTKRAFVRCTPKIKNLLSDIKNISGETAADLLEWAAELRYNQIQGEKQ